MRRIRAPVETKHAEKKPASAMEPIAEGIRRRKPMGFYSKMGDREFFGYVKRFMMEHGIEGRAELAEANSLLYKILREREKKNPEAHGKIDFARKLGNWSQLVDAELIRRAKIFMERMAITGKKELAKANGGLYKALNRRERISPGIIEKIGFERKRRDKRDWKAVLDEELVGFARKFMKAKGISSKTELRDADGGLYEELRIRGKKSPGIMEKIGFVEKRGDWEAMSDGEIVDYTREFISGRGIRRRKGLSKAAGGLYNSLRKRERKDPEIFLKIGVIETRHKQRDWKSMDDDEIVDIACRLIKDGGIIGKRGLQLADSGLYSQLFRRGLIMRVFSPIEQESKKDALLAIKNATEGFE